MRPTGGDELRRLLFGRCVAEKVAAANLRAGEVLQQVRTAQRRVKLDMEVEPCRLSLHPRLMQRHDVRKRHAPEIVEPDHTAANPRREIPPLPRVQIRNRRDAPKRRDVGLVRVSREVRNERNRAAVTADETPSVLLLRGENVLEQMSAGLLEMPASGEQLRFDGLEGEVGRVNLAVRVRIADADDFALVLENED